MLGSYTYTVPPFRQPRGTLIFSDRQMPDALNPLFSSSPVDFEIGSALWAAPVVFDAHFHAQPDQLTEVPLPENGDVRDNGLTIVMHLRHDLRWSDGQPLLASDFQYWWHLNQDPNTGAITTGGYDQIASIDTPDDYTVVLHMKHPYGPYLLYLPYAAPRHAWSHYADIDLQNAQDVYLAPTVTSGPYKLARFDNQSYTLVPNANYHSSTFHGPFISRLIYRMYPTLPALAAAVKAGQTNVSEGYMEYELPALARLPANVSLLKTPAAAYEHLDFNMARPMFQDVRVRRAIQLAIDRCGIIREVLGALDCSRLASQVEPQPSLYNDPAIQAAPYDPTTARKLLAQAGWQPGKDGILTRQGQSFSIHLLTTSDNPLRAAAAQRIQHDLRAVGIAVSIQYADLGPFFALYTRGGLLATGNYDLAMFGYQDAPDPDDEYNTFHSSQIPTADAPDLGNYGRVRDPVIDQALTLGRQTVPFADRARYYHRFLERLASQVYLIPLYVGVNILTVENRVHNVDPNPNAVVNNWNIADWWM
ncbi:MAG TPA: peptide ABC transporter substrate-binding protein [Ktedonobacteraceae bacterium]|nr:peptide ABC transporter substrate-binding protein [Ktedonobacteraceae bacterium]